MKGCPEGSHHRPEGHPSHSGGGRKERSDKYTSGKAATWGVWGSDGEGRCWVGLELGWDKDKVGMGLGVGWGGDGVGLGVWGHWVGDENVELMELGL